MGDVHVPGKAQALTVFEEINGKPGENELTDRTWQSWFSKTPRVPKLEKIKILDKLADSAIRVRAIRSLHERALPTGTFSELIHGGLAHHMLAPTKSKQPLNALLVRAENYQPLSPLHLHLDAIEIDALSDGFEDVPWDKVKGIGAQRILKLLAERWGPRNGSVYSEISSRFLLEAAVANSEERSKLLESYARNPSLFEYHMFSNANPNWGKTGVDADVPPLHIYKVLFALAADTEFLVADRLSTWSLDLATAALATHALAWSDRYTTFAPPYGNILIFWRAFNKLLFNTESLEPDNMELNSAMARCSAEWDIATFETFLSARKIYHSELTELGVSVNEVFTAAMQATTVHPLEYVG